MEPIKEIEKLYYENFPNGNFWQEVLYYVINKDGILFKNSDYAVFAKPSKVNAPQGDFPLDECDCWFVPFAAGDVAAWIHCILNQRLQYKYICYFKNDKFHKIETKGLLKHG